MKIGMLWFDGEEHKEIPTRVRTAADYYRSKYGRAPNVCFVHPSMLAERGAVSIGGVDVRPSPAVLRGHLWIGIDDREA